MKAQQPIFVCGMMRSGTTLLRALIGQHSDVAAGLETFWFEIDPQSGKGRGEEELGDFLDRMATYFELPLSDLEAIATESQDAAAFLDGFMAAFAAHQGKSRWAEKTPANILHLDKIFAGWPDPRVVHIIRDPRDV